MRRIGLVVNPVAGLGGSVGLKGTDNNSGMALLKGAVPHSGARATEARRQVHARDIEFLTCTGPMGEESLEAAGIASYRIVYTSPPVTSGKDTMAACRRFLEEGVSLILFCGGDGTARDVFDVAGLTVPVLGIPAGVKMYSAVFTIDPAAAGLLVDQTGQLPLRDAEVLDVDEEAYRKGILLTKLYGIARVPFLENRVQVAKQVIEEQDEERAKGEIARFISEVMLPDTLYILGAGTTTESIAQGIGMKKTLLGVDIVRDGKVIARDADERTLLSIMETAGNVKIIVSPIGAQGFIFGRGTQQISAAVIRKAGVANVIVVATPAKCSETPFLHVDTGDASLDAEFGASVQVITGYRIAQRKKIGGLGGQEK